MKTTKIVKRLHEVRRSKAQAAEVERLNKLAEARKVILNLSMITPTDDPRYQTLGEGLAKMLYAQMNTPSLSSMAIRHSLANPSLSLFECIAAVREECLALREKAIADALAT